MKYVFKKIVIALFGLAFIWGCEDPAGAKKDEPNYLFKAIFTNDWLTPEDGEAVLFLSDEEGNILADATWSGNDSLEFSLDNGLNKSMSNDLTHISVTTATKNGITTNINIPVGSSWTFKGYPTVDYNNPPFSVELDFENVPDYKDYYVISSLWNSIASTSTTLGSPFNFTFYESPMDIYVKLNTVSNGVKYLWLNSAISGSRKDDLSNMNSVLSQTIALPGDNSGYRKYLYGISNPGHRYEGRYQLDYGRDYNPTNSVNVYYPPDSFSDYRTAIYLIDERGKTEWYQSTYGEIPNSLTKIRAEFEYMSVSADNFEITTTGDYTQSAALWQSGNYSFIWGVYAGKGINKYKLPTLPNSVTELFNIDRSSFELWLTDIIEYPELSSYSEVLEILFNSQDYFYDVVNEMRRYTKYSPGDGFLKQSNNNIIFEDMQREPFINY